MKLFKPDIENHVLLLTVLIVAVWLGLSLVVFNAGTTVNTYNLLLTEIDGSRSDMARLNNRLMQFIGTGEDEAGTKRLRNEITTSAYAVHDDLAAILIRTGSLKDPYFTEKVKEASGISTEISSLVNNDDFYAPGGNKPAMDKTLLLISRFDTVAGQLSEMAFQETGNRILKMRKNVVLIIIAGLLLVTVILLAFSSWLGKSSRSLIRYLKRLSRGDIPEKLQEVKNAEAAGIISMLNAYADSLAEKISYLENLSKDNQAASFRPGPDDKLGNAMLTLEMKLKQSAEEDKKRTAEEKRRSWNSEGLALFGEILRSERENVAALSFNIIQNMVDYLNIEAGTIFLAGKDEETGEKYLETIATYAFDRRKHLSKRMAWGEGLPGTCALEKEKIFITEVPSDYFEISSGLGDMKPQSVLLVPLNLEDEIFGIIELASVRIMETYEIQFIETLAQSIASTLSAVKNSERTSLLLKQSRQQAEELLRQDQKMKENLKELEMARNESVKKASEISGILNAINQSSLVAEFSVNGRFSSLNDKFLLLLESPADQILGKHHNEFAMVDRYSEDYKAFWSALRNGETRQVQERYKLFNGKEIWLQETFSPILNSDRKVYKILDIAIDITMPVEQQESLKSQAAEITRQTLELSSLNDAVNSSIIKCELDTEGIITDLNENFISSSGYNRKELLGRNYRLFLREQEKEQFEKIWSELVKEKTYQGVIRRTRPTGEEVWLMATFSPVKNEEGKIYKIYFLALDITEKRLKYQLLEEANREIERLKELLSSYN